MAPTSTMPPSDARCIGGGRRRVLATRSVFLALPTALSHVPFAPRLLRHRVDEPPYDAKTHEEVEHSGERGGAEVEGVQRAPSLHYAVEDRPAQQQDDDEVDGDAEVLAPPPSPPQGASQPEDWASEVVHSCTTSERRGRSSNRTRLVGTPREHLLIHRSA